MNDLSDFNVTNITSTFTKTSTEDDTRSVALEVSWIATIVINIITSPLTVLLNVLVIMAVKRRPRLQSYTNILLACLAATDVLTGLIVQPSFILWKIFELLGVNNTDMIAEFQNSSVRLVAVGSLLHLALVTCERLVAIKFTMHYPYIVTKRNIKIPVITFWVFLPTCDILLRLTDEAIFLTLRRSLVAFTLISCVLFISAAYAILYRETLRHQKKIKTQQLPQEEVERFAKEHKALKTTVFVVGAVVLCFVPVAFFLLLTAAFGMQISSSQYAYFPPWIRTFGMLNSLLNPLIYCWRQKEMRKFVFGTKRQAVDLANQ